MKKIMVYLLVTALACGLVVSVGYAQAPPALEHAPPFMLPPPPPIPNLEGCWSFEYVVNSGTSNEAYEIQYLDYLKIEQMEGAVGYGTYYYKRYPPGYWQVTDAQVMVNGSTISTISGHPAATYKYMIGTLAKNNGTFVIYGMGIASFPDTTTMPVKYLNRIFPLRVTLLPDVSSCPPQPPQ